MMIVIARLIQQQLRSSSFKSMTVALVRDESKTERKKLYQKLLEQLATNSEDHQRVVNSY